MVSDNKSGDTQQLDRLMEVMQHFQCREPGELEDLLELPGDSLTKVFRKGMGTISPEAETRLITCGVSREFIRHGRGAMLAEMVDAGRLEVMTRHAAHLLKVICKAHRKLEDSGEMVDLPRRVTDGRPSPTELEEELINLLVEALNDPQIRERLLKFVRSEAENRGRPGPFSQL